MGFNFPPIAVQESQNWLKTGQGFKSKSALALTLDVGGGTFRFVIWPKEDGSLPQDAIDLKTGSIIATLLLRNKPDRPFSVKNFQIIREPVDTTAEEEKEEESA